MRVIYYFCLVLVAQFFDPLAWLDVEGFIDGEDVGSLFYLGWATVYFVIAYLRKVYFIIIFHFTLITLLYYLVFLELLMV